MGKKKKRGPKFKKRRAFNREEAFPKKVAQEKMAEEMQLYQHMVMSIGRAFPDRQERMEYIQELIDGLVVEDENDGSGSDDEVRGSEEEAGEGTDECGRDSGAETD